MPAGDPCPAAIHRSRTPGHKSFFDLERASAKFKSILQADRTIVFVQFQCSSRQRQLGQAVDRVDIHHDRFLRTILALEDDLTMLQTALTKLWSWHLQVSANARHAMPK